MSFRGEKLASHRPLIDLIPDDIDASDEEDAFYAKDEDYIIHPSYKAALQTASNRVPRRVKRYFGVYCGLLLLVYIAWWSYLGPRHAANKKEWMLMEKTPLDSFGVNMRPQFKDMIQVKELDSKFVPGAGETENRRLIVVGDVHGCREELEALLEQVQFSKETDHLIFTGDIIGKGPDTPGVVELAIKNGASSVRGNWEDKVLLSLADMRAQHATLPGPDEDPTNPTDYMDEESFSHGDYKTRKLAKELSAEHVKYLQSLPVILSVGQVEGLEEVLVVHAGLIPNVPLERQDPFQCMNMRTIDLETRVGLESREGSPWEKFWNHQQDRVRKKSRSTVIYGHDSKRGKNIHKYSKGLDSGCVKGGKLTAMVIEHGKSRIESVKCKKANGYK